MYVGEHCKIWLERIPWCVLAGAVITSIGIGLLVKFRNDLIDVAKSITKTFFDGRESSSLLKGHKTFWVLFYCFIAVTLLVLMMGLMANGDFRARLFRTKVGRIMGALTCGFFMCLIIALMCGYIHHAEFYSQYYFLVLTTDIECELYPYRMSSGWCMFHTQANILIDEDRLHDFRVCWASQKASYCKEYNPKYKKAFLKIYFSFCVIIMGLVVYCMCLAADYVKIRCQAKFQELEDLRSLELDMGSKDRF